MNRIFQPLNHRWRFQIDGQNIGLREDWAVNGLPAYREIMIPHTFNTETGTEDYRGVAWYEYHFNADAAWDGKRVQIEFNGVYRDAEFWMNGIPIGSHYHSGFTTFQINTGDTVVADDQNILTVRVQNHYSPDALPTDNHFDWADDGGIFREARFIVTDQFAVDYIQIYASPKIPNNKKRHCTVPAAFSADIHFHYKNTASGDNVQIRYELYKGTDNDLEQIFISPEYDAEFPNSFRLPELLLDKVRLWHFDSPQLYTLKLEVLLNGITTDHYETAFGFRELKTEGAKFTFNGEEVRLVGTEWMPGSNPAYGNAEPKEYLEKILLQLKESNCIFTRFHWQQDKAIYDWCDRNGMLVQEEVPHWGNPTPPGSLEMDIAKKQAVEMIRSHCNHPSIIAWGMGNELKGQAPETMEYMKKLNQFFKDIDPTRMVSYVSNTMWEGHGSDATGAGDFMMVNDYLGTWHSDSLDDTEPELIKAITMNPDKPLIISEFGLCEPAFSGGDKQRSVIYKTKTEIYQKLPQIAGFINFCLNDYRTQMGEEGEGALKRRVHGSTDIFGEPKPSYYLVQVDCSPVSLVCSPNSDGIRTITITCKDSLPCYTVSGYQLILYNHQKQSIEEIDIPELAPGQTYVIEEIQPNSSSVCIKRPTGGLVLEQKL